MFNIAQFSSHIKEKGTIQTNKFYVEIPTPTILIGSEEPRTIQYRASSVRIPGVSFDFQNVFRYGVGPQQKIPTNVHFTDTSINFIDTENNELWKYFAVWMNGIFDFTGESGGGQAAYNTEYKDYYTCDIKVYIFDNDAILRTVVVLKDAFPTNLGDVSVSWSENNKLFEFTVNFSYKEWYYDGYAVQNFQSGAELGPAASSAVIPPRTSPRPNSSTGFPNAEVGLNPSINTPQNPYAPRNNPLTNNQGMNFGLF